MEKSPVVAVKDSRDRPLERAMSRHQYSGDALIEVLHTAKELYGYLSPEHLKTIARKLRLPSSRVLDVASFYHCLFARTQRRTHLGQMPLVIAVRTRCGELLDRVERG